MCENKRSLNSSQNRNQAENQSRENLRLRNREMLQAIKELGEINRQTAIEIIQGTPSHPERLPLVPSLRSIVRASDLQLNLLGDLQLSLFDDITNLSGSGATLKP